MKNVSGVMLFLCAVLFFLPGCRSGFSNEYPDEILKPGKVQEERTIWIEEVRKQNGVNVLGHLEKRQLIKSGVNRRKHAFFVYDDQFHDDYKGMMLDNGETFVHSGKGELSKVGLMGLEEAVKRILGYEQEVTFFRNGRQVFHDK